MTVFQSIILGVVEGITEFLPISSTGHLILASKLLVIPQTDFVKSFEIVIQLGAITSVVMLYWRSLTKAETIKKLLAAFIPTGILGLIFYQFVKTHLIGNETVVLLALAIGGALLIVFELFRGKKYETALIHVQIISYREAVLLGFCQAFALVPGVSRSAATILGGLMMRIDRKTIVEFSFLLAVPTMLAATGLDLLKNASSFSFDQFGILAAGFIVAFLCARWSIVLLLKFINGHGFILFGIYRIAVAALFWIVF